MSFLLDIAFTECGVLDGTIPTKPGSNLWETVFMPKRNLRIIKRVKNVPVIGICEFCKVQFQAEHQPAGQQARAQAVIQQQFNAHKCAPADGGQAGSKSS
jgi:hypothetical protein